MVEDTMVTREEAGDIGKKANSIIFERKKECDDAGEHKKANWFLFNAGRYVGGICSYCLSDIKRPLTDEEYKTNRKFYDSLREPFDV
ncbi:hypothetical protein GF336_03200 [Candidatus Woesearchaeota archaeon]|nr:hypothetical protein [Candidatus Woesearchaeota archaeon]